MGNQNLGKDRNNGIGFLGATPGSSFSEFSPRLGSVREIGSTQASVSWTLVKLLAAAAAVVSSYRRCGCSVPLLPLSLAASTAGSGSGCAVHCRRRHHMRLPSLPLSLLVAPSSAAVGPCLHCCRSLPLPPLPLAATAAVSRSSRSLNRPRCCRRLRLLSLVVVDCSCRHQWLLLSPLLATLPGWGRHCHRVESMAVVVVPSQPPPDVPATAAATAIAVTPCRLSPLLSSAPVVTIGGCRC